MDFIKYVFIALLAFVYFIEESCALRYDACFEDQQIKLTFAVNSSYTRSTKDRSCCGSPATIRHGTIYPQPTLVPIAIESDCTYCEAPETGVPICHVCMQPLALNFRFIYDRFGYSSTIERETPSETSPWIVRISIRVLSNYRSIISRIFLSCNEGMLGPEDEIPTDTGTQGASDSSNKNDIPATKVSYKDSGVTSAAAIAGWCIAVGLGCALVALFIHTRISQSKDETSTQRTEEHSPSTQRYMNGSVTSTSSHPTGTANDTTTDARYEPLRSDQLQTDPRYTDLQICPTVGDLRYEHLRSNQLQTDPRYTDLQISPAVGGDGYLHPINARRQISGIDGYIIPISDRGQSDDTKEPFRSYQDASIGNQDTSDNLPLYKL